MRNIIMVYILALIIIIFLLDNIFKFSKNKKIKYLYLSIYFIFLYLCLFDRNTYSYMQFSDGTYINQWVYKIFISKTIFINIIGNIFIFVPMGVFIKQIKVSFVIHLMQMILIIIFIELIQYFTKIGIFDILNIILNLFGSTFGYIITSKKRWNYE